MFGSVVEVVEVGRSLRIPQVRSPLIMKNHPQIHPSLAVSSSKPPFENCHFFGRPYGYGLASSTMVGTFRLQEVPVKKAPCETCSFLVF